MLRFRRNSKKGVVDEKRLSEVMKGQLADYIKREELRKYLEDIERDKRKKELWDSLSPYKKIKILRYVLEKRRGNYGKK